MRAKGPNETVDARTETKEIYLSFGPAARSLPASRRDQGPAELHPDRPAGAQMVDLTGKYVMPGIINLHGHLGNPLDLTQDAKFFTRENVEKNLETYASYGVTAMLSMGTDQDPIFQIRDRQRAGRPSMTRVFTAGQGFIFRGGYGGIAGVNQGVSSAGEVESAGAAQARKKVDIIKLWMDDELGRLPKMPYPIAKAIIDDAHRHHLRVTAHIFY